jgi:ribosomal protein S18 acetylase RimI-like enzyme
MASSAGPAHFRAATDHDALHLEVTPSNESALGLYRRHGFELRGRSLMTRPVERKQDVPW